MIKVLPLSRTILIWLGLKLYSLCYTISARTEDTATLRSDQSAGRVTEGRHIVVALFLVRSTRCPFRAGRAKPRGPGQSPEERIQAFSHREEADRRRSGGTDRTRRVSV